MELSRNSVWGVSYSDYLETGLYRILEVFLSADCIILFPLDKLTRTVRPVAISIETFTEYYNNDQARRKSYDLPSYLMLDDALIPPSLLERRDKNYQLISGLVDSRTFLFDYATQKRSSELAAYANRIGIDRKSLSRLLTQFWRYGQSKMAMLPAYANSGGAGSDRVAKEKPLGAPKKQRTLAIQRSAKYQLSGIDKDNLKKILKKYYLKENGLSLNKAYKALIRDYFEDEVRIAGALGVPPHVPSMRQFRYWTSKLFSKDQLNKATTSENDFLRNKRGALGSVTQHSFLPGSHFEIDATVADIHIVSALGEQYLLGRPTIYVVVDRASRMIVGLHVSLYYASWKAARQALANCFLPKSDYCRQFGIDIDESEWPCAHIPKNLVCDNGEMIGLKPQEILTPMTQLSFTPPYRPDCKGVVEKRFDIVNEEVIHESLGSTQGGNIVRGSRDPRKDAIYTLKDVTNLMIKAVLEHNRSIFGDLASSSLLLIQHDLSPTPINYWKIHLSKHMHALTPSNPNEVIARLLPASEASITRNGISFNGMYYFNDEAERLNLASIARTNGHLRVETRIDENTADFIYVKLGKQGDFIKSRLLPRSRLFQGQSMIEADFMHDWLANKKELQPISVESIDDHKERKQMAKDAKLRAKSSTGSFQENVKNIRKHRNEEINATTNNLKTPNDQVMPQVQANSPSPNIGMRKLPSGRKRQVKDSEA